MSSLQRGLITVRAEASVRIGAGMCSPRATAAWPTMIAFSQPARTGKDGTGRQVSSYSHSPSGARSVRA